MCECQDRTTLNKNSNDTRGGKKVNKLELGKGTVVGLKPGEEVETVNPGRPNAGFDPFILAVTRQVGVALEIPFEILIKHFTASYSASRAALLKAWRFYNNRRKWLADNFCQVVYQAVITESVAMGRLPAPGFFDDPLIKKAYLGAQWTGDSAGQIDPLKEVNAAEKRLALGITTLSEETVALTGGDWERKHPQQIKEQKMRKDAGLIPVPDKALLDFNDTDNEPDNDLEDDSVDNNEGENKENEDN